MRTCCSYTSQLVGSTDAFTASSHDARYWATETAAGLAATPLRASGPSQANFSMTSRLVAPYTVRRRLPFPSYPRETEPTHRPSLSRWYTPPSPRPRALSSP